MRELYSNYKKYDITSLVVNGNIIKFRSTDENICNKIKRKHLLHIVAYTNVNFIQEVTNFKIKRIFDEIINDYIIEVEVKKFHSILYTVFMENLRQHSITKITEQ